MRTRTDRTEPYTQVTSAYRSRNNRCFVSLFLGDDGTAHVIGHATLTGPHSIEHADDRPHAVALSALVQGF